MSLEAEESVHREIRESSVVESWAEESSAVVSGFAQVVDDNVVVVEVALVFQLDH